MGQVVVVGLDIQSRCSKCTALMPTGGWFGDACDGHGCCVLRDGRALSDRHRGVWQRGTLGTRAGRARARVRLMAP
jgi:hypothetical protein